MTDEAREVEKALQFYGVYENFLELRDYQEPNEKMHYMDTVCEALTSNSAKAAMLQKLYNDIANKSTFDTDMIDKSAGTFTKFKGYQSTMNSIEALESLHENKSEEMILARKLSAILVKNRGDYEFGYKTDDFFIMSYYRLTILTILELINVSMVQYMLTVRGNAVQNGVSPHEQRKVTKNAKALLKVYEGGKWALIMREMKKVPLKPATEGIIRDSARYIASGGVLGNAQMVMREPLTTVVDANGNPLGTLVGDVIRPDFSRFVHPAFGKISSGIMKFSVFAFKAAAIFTAVMAAFFVLRIGVYYFFSLNAKLESWLTTQAELLRFNIESNRSSESNAKKEASLRKMESAARFIRVKILKTEKDVDKSLLVDSKSDYSSSEIAAMNMLDTDVDMYGEGSQVNEVTPRSSYTTSYRSTYQSPSSAAPVESTPLYTF